MLAHDTREKLVWTSLLINAINSNHSHVPFADEAELAAATEDDVEFVKSVALILCR